MAYTIYGGYLRPGYCEVHPDVNQTYPCSECIAYDYPPQQEQPYPESYAVEMQRYYEKMQLFDAVSRFYNGIPASAVHERIDKWYWKDPEQDKEG